MFNYDGADTSAAEVTKAGKHKVGEEDVDIVQNSVAGIVTFEGAATGDFDGEILVTSKVAKVPGDPRWTVTAKFDYADVVVEATDITDGKITDAITAKAAGKVVKNLTLNLAASTAYTVTAPIVAAGNVSITGADGATIDASGIAGDNKQFIVLDNTAEYVTRPDDTKDPSHLYIESVTIKDVTITGMPDGIIRDAQKTLLKSFTIDNCNIQAPNKVFVNFQGKGYVGTLTVKNSTIWSADNAQFFAQYGSRLKNIEGAEAAGWTQAFDIENSTFYHIAYGKNICDFPMNNQKCNVYTLKNNIFVDCGKSAGQVVVGFNKGGTSANPVWDVDGNVFNYDGADTSADEVTKAGKKDDADIVKNSYAGIVTFTDAANGDFNGVLSLASGATAPTTAIGDPRWTLTAAASYTITIGDCIGGTVKCDKPYAAEGTKVYATFTPAEGYSPSGIVPTIKNDAGEDVTKDIQFDEDETGSYLLMPGFNITVSVVFQPLPKFYIFGDMNGWDRTKMIEMTYNKETDKYEYEFAPTSTVYFAFSDKQLTAEEDAADPTWNIFDATNRYSLGPSDVVATLGEIKSLVKGQGGTIVMTRVKQGTTYKISVEKDFNAVTFEGEAAPILPYVVAGSSTELFGTAWDASNEANAMTLNTETGKYEITYTNVTLSAGDILYKIVKDGSTWLPADNKILNIPAAGTYDVTFTIDPATDEITAVATVATGIYNISVDGAAADIFSDGKPVYNLSGQRVFKGYKGVAIKNGRKIVVK